MVTTYTDLYRYRELFGSLWRRDLESKYKGSLLGVLWVLIPPLVLMGVYLFVFHYMWRTTAGELLPALPAGRPRAVGLLRDVGPDRRAARW